MIVAVAPLPGALFGQASTDDIVAYWKLDEIVGGRSWDAVGSSDLTVTALTVAEVVEGKWGHAIGFGGVEHVVGKDSGGGRGTAVGAVIGFQRLDLDEGLAQTADRRVFFEGPARNNPVFV